MKNTRGTAICISTREVKMALCVDKVHVYLVYVNVNLQEGVQCCHVLHSTI